MSGSMTDDGGLAIGAGGKLVAGGAVWTFGPGGGDGMAAILRNGAELAVSARAAALLWRSGALYARDASGGWTRFDGNHWRPVPDSGPDAPARPLAPVAASAPKCRVCGEPANTIRGGRDYCSLHHEGHVPHVPITPCAICGEPAVSKVGGRDMCRHHAARMPA